MYSKGVIVNQWQDFFRNRFETIRNRKEYLVAKRKGKDPLLEDTWKEFKMASKQKRGENNGRFN